MVTASAPAVKRLDYAASLLDWYDRQGRDLPWRVKGAKADPYRVWLSEIMLQQTTVEAVKPYFAKFLALWPDVKALAAAEDQAVLTAWAGLGYYARARNLMACARIIAHEWDGKFPQDEAGLRALPGLGAYTAAAVAAIAFGERALVVDGNIERVITRLRAIETPLPQAKRAIRATLDEITPADRPGDFAQAMMDLGATICTPKKPACLLCPWQAGCLAHARGDMLAFPVKPPKKAGKRQATTAFVVVDDRDRLLLRTRPEKGLLGGMTEVPTTVWSGAPQSSAHQPPLDAQWIVLNQPVIHVFTHITLTVTVQAARVGACAPPEGMRWVAISQLDDEPLPTLMRKVIAGGLTVLGLPA